MRNGIFVLAGLLGFPLLMDILFRYFFSETLKGNVGGLLGMGYLQMLPIYIVYLIVASAIVYLWNKRNNR